MSAAMQQGLAALLVRKTEEGRAKARRSIEVWQGAIGAVHQAEKMAECKINLATNQIEGPRQAAAQVDAANYVLAAHLANKATAERNAVIRITTATLQEHISRLELEEYHNQDKIRSAVKERDSAVAELKSKRDSGFLEFHDKRPLWLRVRLRDDPADTLTICICVALGVVFYQFMASFIQQSFLRFSLSVVVGFASSPAVSWLIGWLREAHSDAGLRFARAARERTFQKTSQAAGKRLLEVTSEFEEGLKHAKAQRTKVEDALRWFQSQVSTSH